MGMRRFRVGLVGLAVAVAAPLWWASSPSAHAAADGCAPGVKSDFDGDGRSDTVVADPYATVAGKAQAGRVIVLYGAADGLIGEGSRGVVHQGSTARVLGVAEANDRFGFALSVADIDCDGFTDLVVGTPTRTSTVRPTPATYRSSGAPVPGSGAG